MEPTLKQITKRVEELEAMAIKLQIELTGLSILLASIEKQ